MSLILKNRPQGPALKLKSHRTPAIEVATGEFNATVLEAIRITTDLNAINTSAGRKLSADALLRETLAVTQSSPERIAKLRASVESKEPGWDHTRATLRRMIQFLRSPNWSIAPKKPRRLDFLSTDATNGELALRRSSSVELFCVAVQIAGKQYPECFGSSANSSEWEVRFAELSARQKHLFDKISTTLTSEDLHIGPLNREGLAKVTFKMSDGNVPIAPQDNAGERLVNYLLANATRTK